MQVRQVVLDTETTSLDVQAGHRVIEIGCVEMVGRRLTGNDYHVYLHPETIGIDPAAQQVHGITMEKLRGKPKFREVALELWSYLQGAELIIHNAQFDVGFLDMEFGLAGIGQPMNSAFTIIDTISLARQKYPGQRAGLDALCARFSVDTSRRTYHGAMLDAQLLAEVYLSMTGGQATLSLAGHESGPKRKSFAELLGNPTGPLPVIKPTDEEMGAHLARMKVIAKKSGKEVWDVEPSTS